MTQTDDLDDGSSILITGANRGLGLETVKQLLENSCQKRHIFATCHDPDGSKSEALRELAQKHPSVIIIHLDVDDPCSIKESAKKVGSLLGNNGLNLLVNNAAIIARGTIHSSCVEDMKNTFNTNVIGSLLIIREYLPYLKTSAKTSRTPGMSCNKAAVFNISSVAGSMTRTPSNHIQSPVLPYGKDTGWVKTELGGEKAPLEPKESVKGMLRVIGSLTEKQRWIPGLHWRNNSLINQKNYMATKKLLQLNLLTI